MFWNYLYIGFKHVVPLGLDHILFIISLFFFNSKLKTAIIQCTIFTIAHSFTLALVSLNYITFNPKIIEVLIAVSIFIVSFENVFQPTMRLWRLIIIFAFGLLHGMGFANALKEVGLPKNEFVISILGFNLGVEFAQILLILLCFLVFGKLFQHKDWYHTKMVIPISIFISTIALFWSIQRFLN